MKTAFLAVLLAVAFMGQVEPQKTEAGTEPPADAEPTSIEPSKEDSSVATTACRDCGPADDPAIYPGEIAAPAMDSRDPAWRPIYATHSGEIGPGRGADSLACGGRRTCEDYKAVEVARTTPTPSSTPTEEAAK